MDADDILAKKPGDPLGLLLVQDLDPLSVAELDERIAALQREIARTQQRRDLTVHHRANADSLFKR